MPELGFADAFDARRGPRDGDGAATLSARWAIEHLESEIAGTRFAGHGRLLDRIESTNDTLHEMARQGAPAGSFVLAEEQTAGRGRQRRSWISPAGLGLFLSVLLRPTAGPATWWTLGAAVAACDACRSLGAVATSIKWPNDLLVGPDKVGGILVETRSAGAAVQELVLGLGINVHHDAAEIAAIGIPSITSLHLSAASGMVGGRTRLAGEFLKRFDAIAGTIEAGDWPDVAAAWLERAPRALDAPVKITSPEGRRWTGISAGLAGDGALLVRDASDRVHEVRQVDSVRFTEG